MLADGPSMSLVRAHGSQVTNTQLANVNWADFTLNPGAADPWTKLVATDDTNAYVIGFLGISVEAVDGSGGHKLAPPVELPVIYDALGGFAVDGGDVYACYDGDDTDANTLTATLGRFDGNGNWEALFVAPGEQCFTTAVTTDDVAVYWSTGKALRSWNKVLKQANELATYPESTPTSDYVPRSLAVSGPWLLDFSATGGLVAHDKHGSGLLQKKLWAVSNTEPLILGMVADDKHAYLLDQTDLHRIPLDGGAPDIIAHRDGPSFVGLAQDATKLYFASHDPDGTLTLRSVSK